VDYRVECGYRAPWHLNLIKNHEAMMFSRRETHNLNGQLDAPGKPQELSVASNGASLYLKIWGETSIERNIPHLLFVHGAAHTQFTFDGVARLLARDCVLATYDLRGHGASTHNKNSLGYEHSQFVGDMRTVVESFQAYTHSMAPIPVIASSISGLHALEFAAEYPHLVSHLVLVDIIPMIDPRVVNRLRKFFTLPEFDSFEEMKDRFNFLYPTRSSDDVAQELEQYSSLQPNGKWAFNYDQRVIDIVCKRRTSDMIARAE